MIFLNSFHMLSKEEDEDFFNPSSPLFKRKSLSTYHATEYPFVLFRDRNLTDFVFEDITIFYGNNGSGKSTILNVMAEALNEILQVIKNVEQLRLRNPFQRIICRSTLRRRP